jgi:hypothetical protein
MRKTEGFGHINNMFVSEDVGLSRPPTVITDQWLNDVQSELVAAAQKDGAALGASDHQLADVLGSRIRVFTADQALPSANMGPIWHETYQSLMTWNGYQYIPLNPGNFVKYYTAGQSLPASNIGPIWHDDYNSIMYWSVYDQNGASYAGYASAQIGQLSMDTFINYPRKGFIRSGTANLSRTIYAALRNWALHNGLFVSSGNWVPGNIAMKDNPDGTTFTVFDVRGEFPRFWDDGRGVDPGRFPGLWQADELKSHAHTIENIRDRSGQEISGNAVYGDENRDGLSYSMTAATGGSETRPRNVTLLAVIKY